MDETRPRIDLRAMLAVLAVVAAAATFWVTSALAADGSSAGDRATTDDPAAAQVQSEGQAPDEDCPEREDGSDGSANA